MSLSANCGLPCVISAARVSYTHATVVPVCLSSSYLLSHNCICLPYTYHLSMLLYLSHCCTCYEHVFSICDERMCWHTCQDVFGICLCAHDVDDDVTFVTLGYLLVQLDLLSAIACALITII